MLLVMLRMLSSMTSAIAFMMPSACARLSPSRSRRCTKWCVSKWKSNRAGDVWKRRWPRAGLVLVLSVSLGLAEMTRATADAGSRDELGMEASTGRVEVVDAKERNILQSSLERTNSYKEGVEHE